MNKKFHLSILRVFGLLFLLSGVVKIAESLIYGFPSVIGYLKINLLVFEKLIFALTPLTLFPLHFLNLSWGIFTYSYIWLGLVLTIQAIAAFIVGWLLLKHRENYFKLISLVLIADFILANIGYGLIYPQLLKAYLTNSIVWIVAYLILIPTLFVYRRSFKNA